MSAGLFPPRVWFFGGVLNNTCSTSPCCERGFALLPVIWFPNICRRWCTQYVASWHFRIIGIKAICVMTCASVSAEPQCIGAVPTLRISEYGIIPLSQPCHTDLQHAVQMCTKFTQNNSNATRAVSTLILVIQQYQVHNNCNLVDPASSHMLVLKTKPCMSQYKLLYGETANGSLKQL